MTSAQIVGNTSNSLVYFNVILERPTSPTTDCYRVKKHSAVIDCKHREHGIQLYTVCMTGWYRSFKRRSVLPMFPFHFVPKEVLVDLIGCSFLPIFPFHLVPKEVVVNLIGSNVCCSAVSPKKTNSCSTISLSLSAPRVILCNIASILPAPKIFERPWRNSGTLKFVCTFVAFTRPYSVVREWHFRSWIALQSWALHWFSNLHC